MPDQERSVKFPHSLNQGQEAGVRCPSCPGYRAAYQADCLCCGRKVAQDQDPKPDVINSVKKCKSELVEAAAVPKPASHAAVPPENQAFKGPRTYKGRQRPSTISTSFQRPSAERNSVRMLQHSTHNTVLRPSSRRMGIYATTRGRPAVRVGPHQDFKGVRTRRGVKGFLVEIRPPKWKKTIWLGTYNTDVEAAGAFDAGVFYTNKPNTKYNFFALKAAFPPLPSHLSLDQPDNMEEIKYFVQKQAKLAAAAARRMCSNGTDTTAMAPEPLHQDLQVEVVPEPAPLADPARVDAAPSSSNSESCLTTDSMDLPTTPDAEHDSHSFFDVIPMDMDYLGGGLLDVDDEAAWVAEYTNYLNAPPGGERGD